MQILTVFNNTTERDAASRRVSKSVTGERVQANGLTPPTVNIVKHRFEKTRKKAGVPIQQIRLVVEDIYANWVTLSVLNQALIGGDSGSINTNSGAVSSARGGRGGGGRSGGPKSRSRAVDAEDQMEVLQIIDEEIVDFEDWMVSAEQPNGVSISISGKDCAWLKDPRYAILLEHPEMLSVNDEYFAQPNEGQEAVLKLQLPGKDKIAAGRATALGIYYVQLLIQFSY